MRRQYVVDECLGPRVVDLLSNCIKEGEFRDLARLFPNGIKDLEWLPQIAEYKPKHVILSSDFKMSKRNLEVQILKAYKLTAVLLTGQANMKFPERIWRLLKIWPKIEGALAADHPLVLSANIRTSRIDEL